MKNFIWLLPALLVLSGCLTEKKRQDVFHRYAREHRAEVLEYCPPPARDVIKEGRVDTIVRVDTVKTKVPYSVPGTTDTIWVDCPESETVYRFIQRTDTLYRENVAELERQVLLRQETEKELAAKEAILEEARGTARKRGYWIGGLLAAIGIGVVLKVKNIIG